MITLYGFGRIMPIVIGGTRDLRAQWALEETGLPYQVCGLDHTDGELERPPYSEISPFHLVPSIDDDGFVVSESAAVVIYLAEKAGKLIPADFEGRTRVTQWCFSALSTVERPLMEIQLIDLADDPKDAERRTEMVKEAERWLSELETRLEGNTWIAGDEFTVADILLATVLREVRKTDLLQGYPRVKAYYDSALSRPAWHRTLQSYADRLSVEVSDIE